MCDLKELWKKVERLQEIMNEAIRNKGVNSPDAIRAIQELRNKMQEYNNLVHR
ncbi:hypothetical protein SAMN04488500_1552 [Sporomusa malonica]|uniref:Spo0E like sporulation regulatory protein n=1 Tax=Sporomusa malonica TaxID=112901 RepID=A0A1W2F7L6_9FIRM|nr:hypothetical protein SAMN04488500_1552 [Sporomusa malonica]